MLAELTQVLDRVPVAAPMQSYLDAIVEDNVLGKPTHSTRQKTAKRLTELYALDPGCPSFRLLRFYWSDGAEGRPMLAFLSACAATRCSAKRPRTFWQSREIGWSRRARSPAGSPRGIRAGSRLRLCTRRRGTSPPPGRRPGYLRGAREKTPVRTSRYARRGCIFAPPGLSVRATRQTTARLDLDQTARPPSRRDRRSGDGGVEAGLAPTTRRRGRSSRSPSPDC